MNVCLGHLETWSRRGIHTSMMGLIENQESWNLLDNARFMASHKMTYFGTVTMRFKNGVKYIRGQGDQC